MTKRNTKPNTTTTVEQKLAEKMTLAELESLLDTIIDGNPTGNQNQVSNKVNFANFAGFLETCKKVLVIKSRGFFVPVHERDSSGKLTGKYDVQKDYGASLQERGFFEHPVFGRQLIADCKCPICGKLSGCPSQGTDVEQAITDSSAREFINPDDRSKDRIRTGYVVFGLDAKGIPFFSLVSRSCYPNYGVAQTLKGLTTLGISKNRVPK